MTGSRRAQTTTDGAETAPAVRRRLPGGQRRRAIAEGAAEFFAEVGFEGRTRDLAARLGVTQALIYRYFPNKQALIDAAMDRVFAERWDPDWDRLLSDSSLDLESRLVRFYCAYHARATYLSVRLFVRAGLDGQPLPGRHGAALTARIFKPVVAALRTSAGLPDLAKRPMMRGERELAMSLHAAVVFLGIRKHVYQMPMPGTVEDVIGLYVATFLAGAPTSLRRLHESEAGDSLGVRQLLPGGET